MKKLTEWLIKPFIKEDITIPVKVGDTILTGKFKNKKTVVKSIRKDVHGMPTINGRKATTFRIPKKGRKFLNAKKKKVTEGVNDPGIFKAVFLAGGPGSGKTFVTKQLFGIPDNLDISMTGMKMVNSDKEFKFLLNKFGFGTDLDKMPDDLFNQLTNPKDKDYSGLRDYSKELTKQRMKQYQDGKLGMIIDGTGHDYNKLAKMKRELEQDGYDTYMIFVVTDLETAQKRNQQRDRILPPDIVKKSWTDVMSNGKAFKTLFKGNISYVDNSKTLNYMQAMRKFDTLMKKEISKFIKKPIKNKIAKSWIKKQQILKQQGLSEAPRVPRKKGQHRGSKSHSDLYTDENPKGTIKGLKFATVKDARASVSKIKNSGRSHAHKIQAAVAMEQRAREMGKTSQAAVYRAFINKMKKKTKARKEVVENFDCGCQHIYEVEKIDEKKWSKKYKKSIDCSNPKGFSQKAHCAGKKKRNEQGLGSNKKVVGSDEYTFGPDWIPTNLGQRKKMKRLHKKLNRSLRTTEDIPSPSRKMVKKMKKKGHTSVPYGSGYKKIDEKFAVRGNKIEKFITGKNLTHKGKKYKEIEFETIKVDNPKKLVTLRILAPKNLFGQEVPVRFQTLRRGPFLKTDTSKLKEDRTKIKKVVGIYGGRFQPFGPHHKKTYEWLKKRVDDAYITTSDIKQPPRHPMNFAEKVRHMVKMGIPKNRIVKEKSPYKAENVLKKYDEKTTAVIYIFGAKDAGRLKGGKYFKDYDKNRGNILGYKEHGYVLTAPHVSIKVGGKEVSGTVMRQLLGSPDYEKNREKLFKQAFGYFDKGVYNMMTNKFKKLFESIDEFLIKNDISKIIKEASTTTLSPTDDGPPTFYKGFGDYKKFSKKWIDNMYAGTGWEVMQYVLGKHAINPDFDYTLSYSTVPAVAYGHKQSGDYGSRFGVDSPIDSYKSYVNDVVLKNLGYEVIKWMGITPDGKNYTGVEVETPVLPGVGDDNVGNTELDKLDLKERINLDDEVKLLIEGGAYGHMNHPFDDKNITFSDLKQIIINGLGGKLDREDGVTEKLDGQNLMVSWVNGKLVTARNKGQLKNFGATAMDTAGVSAKFAGRGDIKNAFVFAMKDLSKSIGKLSDAQKEKVFGNGKRWMNLEVIYPKSANVIDYDKAQIVFHGTLEYNKSAQAIGQPKDSARMLAGMIKQVNQNVQKKYTIGKPQFLTVPKVQDFGKKKRTYLGRLNKLQKQYALNDSDTLSKYHQSFWEEFIFNASKQYNYKIPNKVLVDLTKRWAFSDKSYKIPTIKKDIDNEKFLDWVLSFDKNDHQKWVKQNMKPFEVLFFDVGAEILKNISGYLVASPNKAVQKIRKDVIKAIKTVKSSKDIKKIETLKLQLDKLEAIGGLSSIVPSEGIVFKYKGKVYKFTGAFAPVNQILGLLNF